MAITKNSNRQGSLFAKADFTFADFNAGAVTTTTIFTALDLPANAIVVGGALVITTAFVGPTAATASVGDGASAARFLGDTNLLAAARTALVPTNYKYTAGDTLDLDVAMSVAAATAGAGYLLVEYIIDGRGVENQG